MNNKRKMKKKKLKKKKKKKKKNTPVSSWESGRCCGLLLWYEYFEFLGCWCLHHEKEYSRNQSPLNVKTE
jgi:hypothetical protein